MTKGEAVEQLKIEMEEHSSDCCKFHEALTYALAVLERVEVDKLSDFIYDTIYEDRKPKQEISAGLECRLLAQAIVKEVLGEK